MPDPAQDGFSPEDTQALIQAQQHLYSTGDPRAEKFYNYLVQNGIAKTDQNGALQPMDQMSASPSFGQQIINTITHPLNSLESAAQPVSRPAGASIGEMVGSDLANAGSTIAGAVRHPLNTVGNALSSGFGARPLVENAVDAILRANGRPAQFNNPPIIPQNPDQGARAVGGLALGAALPGAVSLAGEAAPVVGDVMAATADMPPAKLTSPVSPAELSARSINQAINPRVASAQNLIDALQAHAGDVTDYANRNGIGINGALDYSKAAQGAADEAYGQYRSILDPNAAKTVPVPAEYQGALTRTPFSDSGRYANLGQLNSRLGDINNLKAAAFDKTTGQSTMTALEKMGLDVEHAKIADILHNSLGDATGVSPEDIAGLRTKFGKLNTIADQTNASVNAKSGLQANINQGTRNVPLSTGGAVAEAFNRLRGGPQAIADRALVKSIANSPIAPTSLSPRLAEILSQSQGGGQ